MKKNLFFLLTLSFVFFNCHNDKSTLATDATPAVVLVSAESPVPSQTNLPPGYPLKLPIETNYPYSIDLKTPDGKIVNSSEVLLKNGKSSVIMFWLTTCYPCGLELKAIKEKFPQWQEEADFNLYAISTDFQKNAHKIAQRVEAGGWQFDVYHDFGRKFLSEMPGGLNGLPQVFVFDKKGDIVYHKRRYAKGDEDVLFQKVKELAK